MVPLLTDCRTQPQSRTSPPLAPTRARGIVKKCRAGSKACPTSHIAIYSQLQGLGGICVGGAGLGEGEDPCHLRESRFVLRNVWRTTKRETLHSITNRPSLPTSPPESPKRRAIRGERRKWVGTLTQGGARGDSGPEGRRSQAPALAYLGYILTVGKGQAKGQPLPVVAVGLIPHIYRRASFTHRATP